MIENNNEPFNDSLEMKFDLNVLKHLGLKMYTSLPRVISEYVANAWDAWAHEVNIEVPQHEQMGESYEIIIEDNGRGMTPAEVNNKFLVVGRARRQEENKDYVEKDGKKRDVMGRKGIGKLAGFGVADVVHIRTVKDGEFIEFELDYGEMKTEAKEDPSATTTYEPQVIANGTTDEESGTIVTLTDFDRKRRPQEKYIRQRLARRFSVIGADFKIYVNGEEVTGSERNIKKNCQFRRDYKKHPIDEEEGYTIRGWIGTLKNPVPDDIQGGVAVMARGKTAQSPSTFGVAEGGTRGQMTLQYLVGEIHADFLDEEEDLIATYRNEVLWDKTPADKLKQFIIEEIKDICREWPKKRQVEQMENVREEESYQHYIEPLDEREKQLADSFLGKLAKKGDYDDETVGEMASYVSSGVQQKSFRNLLREIEQSDIKDTEKLAELFDQYEVLDAMNSLRVVRGRYYAIQKFEDLVDRENTDINDLHGFVSDNPWLIDPRWDYLDEELDAREQIRNNFPESHKDSRVGFICLGDADTLRVVDVRHPDYVVGLEDLDELKGYVDYLRAVANAQIIRDRDIEGYIVADRAEETNRVESEIRRMKMDDMRFRTYDEIKDIAKRSHHAFLQVFKRKAQRTESEMLRTHLEGERQMSLEEFGLGGLIN